MVRRKIITVRKRVRFRKPFRSKKMERAYWTILHRGQNKGIARDRKEYYKMLYKQTAVVPGDMVGLPDRYVVLGRKRR